MTGRGTGGALISIRPMGLMSSASGIMIIPEIMNSSTSVAFPSRNMHVGIIMVSSRSPIVPDCAFVYAKADVHAAKNRNAI